jgi:hypothetical protein
MPAKCGCLDPAGRKFDLNELNGVGRRFPAAALRGHIHAVNAGFNFLAFCLVAAATVVSRR